jgi:hypothetical protein
MPRRVLLPVLGVLHLIVSMLPLPALPSGRREMTAWVVIAGRATLWGPFDTAAEAATWADYAIGSSLADWRIAPVNRPAPIPATARGFGGHVK